jgi:hypothetical protein
MDRYTNPSPEDRKLLPAVEPGLHSLQDKMGLLSDDQEMKVDENGSGVGVVTENSSEDTIATPKDLSADLLPELGSTLKVESLETFRWEIPNIAALKDKDYSPVFRVGKHNFNILIFPKGNNGNGQHVSLFLNFLPPPEGSDSDATSPSDAYCCGHFLLAMVHPSDNKTFEYKGGLINLGCIF